MTKTNLLKLVALILIFLFFVLYFLQLSGYGEYQQNKKNMLTEKEIEAYLNDTYNLTKILNNQREKNNKK